MCLSLALFLSIIGFANAGASYLVHRVNDTIEPSLSPTVIVLVVIGLALATSSFVAFCLYQKYKPNSPQLPLYTISAPRYRSRGGVRLQFIDNHRGRRPAQGASPMTSLPFLERVSTSEASARHVSIRPVPTMYIPKTKLAAPAMGCPPPARAVTGTVSTA